MVTIKIAQAAVVARNPMLRHVRGARSSTLTPAAVIEQIKKPRTAIEKPTSRVTDGAAHTQSQNPPFKEGDDKNTADKANMSRARILKAVSPGNQQGVFDARIITSSASKR